MIAIDNNGNQVEVLDGTLVNVIDGVNHLLTPQQQTDYNSQQILAASQQNNISIKAQIDALEAQQTPRRMRDAIKDPTWLNNLESQIAVLRSQLTK